MSAIEFLSLQPEKFVNEFEKLKRKYNETYLPTIEQKTS
jgi:hypothetical protein